MLLSKACFNFIERNGVILFQGKFKNSEEKPSGCQRILSCMLLTIGAFPAAVFGTLFLGGEQIYTLTGRCCVKKSSSKKTEQEVEQDKAIRKTSAAADKTLNLKDAPNSLSLDSDFQLDQVDQQNFLTLEKRAMGVYVGKLHQKWTLPSDHLPIGATLSLGKDSNEKVHFCSWNVLNPEYMKFILPVNGLNKDYQGLNPSAITEANVPEPELDPVITKREDIIINSVVDMLNGNIGNVKSIISLQECGDSFIQHLTKRLPGNIALIRSYQTKVDDQSIVLYNTDIFEKTSEAIVPGLFKSRPHRAIMNILLKHKTTMENIRIVTTHLPWIKGDPAGTVFANFLKNNRKEEETLLAMGDMNQDEIEIAKTFKEVLSKEEQNNFSQIFSYPTFIPYYREEQIQKYVSACFDHIFALGRKADQVIASSADEILPNLSAMVKTLSTHAK